MSDAPETRTRAEACFQQWLDLVRGEDDVDRSAFLASQPVELRGEVERMIDDYGRLSEKLGGNVGFETGRQLGDFRLIRELGRGGMGVVWEAEQLSMKRRVALKLLLPHHGLSELSLDRFHREAEAGGRLTHPGIVQVHAVGEAEGLHYMALELVPSGYTLADSITDQREERQLPSGYYLEVAERFAAIAEALAYAHSQGVIHRDVKPSNILIAEGDRPQVADFGLARIEQDASLSRTGEAMGTPYYMSPEQALGKRLEMDARTDIFSLGATLYEALTLRRPFDGDTTQQVVEQILGEDPTDPCRVRSRVPTDLAVICLKALEKKREHRYATMADFAQDLRRHLGHQPIVARPPGALARTVKWIHRHPIVATSGTVAAVALVIITALLFEVSAERDRVTEEGDRAQRESYSANLAAAQLHDANSDRAAAWSRLAACPRELRGWEWGHLSLRVAPCLVRIHTGKPSGFSASGFGYSAVFSPDGRFLLAGGSGARPLLWDAETGQLHRALGNEATFDSAWGGPVTSAAAFSSDGHRIISTLEAPIFKRNLGAKTILVWDYATGEPVTDRVPSQGEPNLAHLTVSPGGTHVVLWSGVSLRWFDARTGKPLVLPWDASDLVGPVAFSPDGARFVASSSAGDRPLVVRDVESGDTLATLDVKRKAGRACVTFSPDGRTIATGGSNGPAPGLLHSWDASTGELKSTFRGHEKTVYSVAFSPDGKLLVSGSEDQTVRLWNSETTECVRTMHAGRSVHWVAFDPDGQRIAAVDSATTRVWDVATSSPSVVLAGPREEVNCVSFSSDGRRVAAGTAAGVLWMWDAATGNTLLQLGDPEGAPAREARPAHEPWTGMLALAFDSGGSTIASGSSDDILRVWDADAGELLHTCAGHEADIAAVAFQAGKERIVTVAADASVRVWDGGTGAALSESRAHKIPFAGVPSEPPFHLALARDGSRVFTSPSSGAIRMRNEGVLLSTLQVWSVERQTILGYLDLPVFGKAAALSSNRERIAAGDPEKTVGLWSCETGTHFADLERSTGVLSLGFDPEDARIVGGTREGALRIWDAQSGVLLCTLTGHTAPVRCVAFSPDGERIASGSADGTVRIWESEIATARAMWQAQALREAHETPKTPQRPR